MEMCIYGGIKIAYDETNKWAAKKGAGYFY